MNNNELVELIVVQSNIQKDITNRLLTLIEHLVEEVKVMKKVRGFPPANNN